MLSFSRLASFALLTVVLLPSAATRASGQTPPPPPPQPPRTTTSRVPPRDTLSDSTRAQLRRVAREASDISRRNRKADTARTRARADSAAPTAFADPEARVLLERARTAREQQDSALKSYSAVATQRISTSLGVRKVGLEKLLFRGDNVARVEWKRGVGVWVSPIGSRMVVPMADRIDGDFSSAVSIPYFPGKESLWLPSSNFATVNRDINERELVHPIARGAETYYRYATGDSISIKLPDGKVIQLRELRITARKPDYRLFVGSFWFDIASGQLVRAAYRLSVDIDIWDIATQETALEKVDAVQLEHLRDSIARATLDRDVYVADSTRRERARRAGNNNDDEPPAWVKASFRPAKAKLDAITVEYGLYQGRFWLPRANSASASAEVGFIRVPFSIDEKFSYESVDGDLSMRPVPPSLNARIAQRDSAIRRGGKDSAAALDTNNVMTDEAGSVNVSVCAGSDCQPRTPATRDSADRAAVARLTERRDSTLKVAKTAADSARIRARFNSRRETQCLTDTTWVRTETRYDGALRVGYRMPCDMAKLQTSSALPAAYTSDEELFDMKTRDELLGALDLSLQPAWSPQWPKVRSGLDLVRYNRVEGLSVGVVATQTLGAGYTATGLARIGHADLHLNGELTLERSNGRRTAYGTVFHRMAASNPEWAGALTLGPSLPAFLYTRDEGFYYRTFGAEVGERVTQRKGALDWRLFVERQYTAGDSDVVNTFSLGRAFGNRHFRSNIQSEPVSLTGVAANWQHAFGNDPLGFRFTTGVHAELATGTMEFARGSIEGTLSRLVGPLAAALTASAGSSVGRLPVQRHWFVGGLKTVRGQIPGTQEGDAFWITRTEVGRRGGAFRPVGFFDVGWAGSRKAFSDTKLQRGAGVGASLLDGLFRIDFSRGLYPLKKWRTDIYLEAPL